MIKWRTITKLETTISIEKREAIKNYTSSFLDHLKGVVEIDYKYKDPQSSFRTEIASLLNNLNSIESKGFRSFFEEGYSLMFLDEPSIEYVDRYFKLRDEHEHKSLEILILNDGYICEKIKEDSIQFWVSLYFLSLLSLSMTTILDKSTHKIKQLTEAIELLEDISLRMAWATDFCKYDSINEILDDVYKSVDKAQSQLEENLEELEEVVESHKEQAEIQEEELEQESQLRYCLEWNTKLHCLIQQGSTSLIF